MISISDYFGGLEKTTFILADTRAAAVVTTDLANRLVNAYKQATNDMAPRICVLGWMPNKASDSASLNHHYGKAVDISDPGGRPSGLVLGSYEPSAEPRPVDGTSCCKPWALPCADNCAEVRSANIQPMTEIERRQSGFGRRKGDNPSDHSAAQWVWAQVEPLMQRGLEDIRTGLGDIVRETHAVSYKPLDDRVTRLEMLNGRTLIWALIAFVFATMSLSIAVALLVGWLRSG